MFTVTLNEATLLRVTKTQLNVSSYISNAFLCNLLMIITPLYV